MSVRVPRPAERPRPRPTRSASRAPHTNTLPLTVTRPASRQPPAASRHLRAGPSGGLRFPDNFLLGLHCEHELEVVALGETRVDRKIRGQSVALDDVQVVAEGSGALGNGAVHIPAR